MQSRIFFATLPALLCSVLPSLALPTQDPLSIEARSFDPSSDPTLQLSREVAEESLMERYYEEDDASVLARETDDDLLVAREPKSLAVFGAAKSLKKAMKATKKVEKATKKLEKATKKAAKVAKKVEGVASKLDGTHALPIHGLTTGKAQSALKTAIGTYALPIHGATTGKAQSALKTPIHMANSPIVKGGRGSDRQTSARITAPPNARKVKVAKGEHLMKPQAKTPQGASSVRLQQKKTDVRAKVGGATSTANHKESLRHGDMPGRHDELRHPHHSDISSDRSSRKGASGSAFRNGRSGSRSSEFRHQEGGLREHRHASEFGHESPMHHSGFRSEGGFRGSQRVFRHEGSFGGSRGGFDRFKGSRSHGRFRGEGYASHHEHSPFSRHRLDEMEY